MLLATRPSLATRVFRPSLERTEVSIFLFCTATREMACCQATPSAAGPPRRWRNPAPLSANRQRGIVTVTHPEEGGRLRGVGTAMSAGYEE